MFMLLFMFSVLFRFFFCLLFLFTFFYNVHVFDHFMHATIHFFFFIFCVFVRRSNGLSSKIQQFIYLKDIPYEQQEYLIENLKPSTEYTVELSMRNKAGVGPAATKNVTTADKPETRPDDETLKLIVVSDHKILMQGPRFFYEPPNIIYESSEAITGVGIHVAKKLIFITDESHTIYK